MSSADPAVVEMLGTKKFQHLLRKSEKLLKLGGVAVASKTAASLRWRDLLHSRVDGRGLISHPDVPQIHRWISDGSSMMRGAEFIGCVQLRAGALPTAKHASRGRPARRVDCDACGRIETVGNILQVCPWTLGHRIRRQDKLCNFVAGKLTRKDYCVSQEVFMSLPNGTKMKPDLVVSRDGISYVIDVTVVADNTNLDSKHRSKVSKYEVPCVTDFVQRLHGNIAAVYTAMAMNWRGAMAPPSFQSMTELGLSQNDLKLISEKTVTDGMKTYIAHRSGKHLRSAYEVHHL